MTQEPSKPAASPSPADPAQASKPVPGAPQQEPKETGGPAGPDPTRFGDWERKGRCIDF